jgi:hypothetical protein
MVIEKFTIHVSDALLADLRRRLEATRWPDKLENVWLGVGLKSQLYEIVGRLLAERL